MKIFIDTANIDQISEANSWGILDGVTTNPTLISKEGCPFRELVLEICKLVDGDISVEVISQQTQEMVNEAIELSKIHKNIVVKIPMTEDGLKATKILKTKGVRTNMTLVFSVNQAIFAAKAGATYVSPFIGRLDDIGHIGMDLVRDIVTVYNNYKFNTQVIVASIRNPLHVIDAALAGAHVVTIPFNVLQQMMKHPLTDIGIQRFLKDWEKVKSL